MPYFPQIAQFPGRKRVVRRTVRSEAMDGRMVKYPDTGAGVVEWRLEFAGMTDEEWEALRSLFEASEGRLRTFTFIDPFDNMLRSSGDLGAAAWLRDGQIALAAGAADPFGGTAATRVMNHGAEAQAIGQDLPVPGSFHYSMSAYARSDEETRVTLFARAGATTVSKEFAIGPVWRRLDCSMRPGEAEEMVRFGVSLGGGAAVELFGVQAEAQTGASSYKRTGSGGVYVKARFADDVMTVNTDGPGLHSASVRILAAG